MELERLETEVRDAKKGLWVDPTPLPLVGLSQSEAGRKGPPGVYVEPSTYE